MRTILSKRIIFLLTLLCGLSAAVAAPRNFLFILVDDLGVKDIGVEGSVFYETPNIDALARSGMRFTNGYAACQVCSPSRASIMLGTTPARHGVTQWIGDKSGMAYNKGDPVMPAEYTRNLPKQDTTIAEAMKAGGYTTFFAGKWHLGDEGSWPEDHGFEINKGGWSKGSPNGGYFAPWKNPRLENGPDGESLTMRLAQETASFIEANQAQPFFAFLSFYGVHGPLQTTEALATKYKAKAARMGLAGSAERFKFDRRLPVRQVQDNPVYAGMMETLDDAVGLLMEKLRATGLDKNTVVIFTSDNGGVSSGDGYATSLLPLRGGKGRQWEGGIREPYYISVPGVTATESTTAQPAIGMDFYPTILELAGLPLMPEQHVDGVSLLPVLEGGTLVSRDLYWHYPHYGNQGGEPSSIIRQDDWKLIFYHEDGRSELYNLKDDLGEQRDVMKQHPELVGQMKAKLDAWLSETGAIMPKPDPRFSQDRFDQKLEKAKTQQLKKLEQNHEQFLSPDWKPNKDWWGSSLKK